MAGFYNGHSIQESFEEVVKKIGDLNEMQTCKDMISSDIAGALKKLLQCAATLFELYPSDDFYSMQWTSDVSRGDWAGIPGPLSPDGNRVTFSIAFKAALDEALAVTGSCTDDLLLFQISAIQKCVAAWASSIPVLRLGDQPEITKETCTIVSDSCSDLLALDDVVAAALSNYERKKGIQFEEKDSWG